MQCAPYKYTYYFTVVCVAVNMLSVLLNAFDNFSHILQRSFTSSWAIVNRPAVRWCAMMTKLYLLSIISIMLSKSNFQADLFMNTGQVYWLYGKSNFFVAYNSCIICKDSINSNSTSTGYILQFTRGLLCFVSLGLLSFRSGLLWYTYTHILQGWFHGTQESYAVVAIKKQLNDMGIFTRCQKAQNTQQHSNCVLNFLGALLIQTYVVYIRWI